MAKSNAKKINAVEIISRKYEKKRVGNVGFRRELSWFSRRHATSGRNQASHWSDFGWLHCLFECCAIEPAYTLWIVTSDSNVKAYCCIIANGFRYKFSSLYSSFTSSSIDGISSTHSDSRELISRPAATRTPALIHSRQLRRHTKLFLFFVSEFSIDTRTLVWAGRVYVYAPRYHALSHTVHFQYVLK